MALTMLLGGARSGKSTAAVARGRAYDGPVLFVATGEVRDAEMADRVSRHRDERPAGWATVEAPVDVSDALAAAPGEALVVVDCLSLWVANLLERGVAEIDIERQATQTARRAARRPAPTVTVSNEVGMGLVPTYELGRRYRDLLGRVNSIWVGTAAEAYLVVAGALLPLHSCRRYDDGT
ncbi:MAG: bifunctional adenosylcobinamide kinase/adenosylcobinamide-phosphate guanylyltransferase [Nocardioidaceae bacterium]